MVTVRLGNGKSLVMQDGMLVWGVNGSLLMARSDWRAKTRRERAKA
jgi:hypothetical protein